MSIDIKIEGSTFNDNASVIRNQYGFSMYDGIQTEIERAQRRTTDEQILLALKELKAAVENNDTSSMKNTAVRFTEAFSSNLFSNIASAGLIAFVRGLLP